MATAEKTRITLKNLSTFLAKCKDTFALKTALNAKQNTLKWDSTPTSGSSNPVTSDGINKALANMKSSLSVDTKSIFPVGSVVINMGTNPSSYLGGTWQEVGKGRVLWGADYKAGVSVFKYTPSWTTNVMYFTTTPSSDNKYYIVDPTGGAFTVNTEGAYITIPSTTTVSNLADNATVAKCSYYAAGATKVTTSNISVTYLKEFTWGHQAGTTVDAGLPNIVGTLENGNLDETIGRGSIYTRNNVHVAGFDGGDVHHYSFGFDASRSNPIYGNSETVQPPAYVVHFWQRTA